MNKKFMLSGLAGGVASYLMGWLMYGILFKDTLAGMAGPEPVKMLEMPNMLPLLVGNMFMGFFVAYIFNNWANITTMMGGLTAGATIGLFLGAGPNLINLGVTNASTIQMACTDTVIYMVIAAVTGAVVGWVSDMVK